MTIPLFPRYLGRAFTRDGAPRGKRPCIESNGDLLAYRDQQLALWKAGEITKRLYRIRIRRECKNYKEFSIVRYEREQWQRAAQPINREEQQL